MLKQLLGPLITQVLQDSTLKINVNPIEVSKPRVWVHPGSGSLLKWCGSWKKCYGSDWISIGFNADPEPAFIRNADPDTDPVS
jgi:hypothetical protein